ncbi:hypothetical protein ACFLXY_00705 [Chloroflexota bacterium]
MKSQALQELIKSIFSSDETKKQFESDPNSVLSQFSLTKHEKKAVLSVHTKFGLISMNSPQLEAAIKAEYDWFDAPQA